MNLKLQIQKQNYEEIILKYKEVEKIAVEQLEQELSHARLDIMQLPHRIKSWQSVEGKLLKKPDRYSKVSDLTDILGIRIVCYFLSNVDEAADLVRRVFDVDTENSDDKRMSMSANSFGYVSLHMICTLRKDKGYPEEIANLKFEIQLRTMLQHAWAEIEHDLGYKTFLEIPREVRREFARIAGLLEIADDSFENIKNSLSKYENETLERIRTDSAGDMTLDTHTLNTFMEHSQVITGLYDEMASMTCGKVVHVGAEGYLPLLGQLGLETLGDLHALVEEQHYHVMILLEHALKYSDLEEITSNAALFYICRAKMVWSNYSKEEIEDIYYNFFEDRKKAENNANIIISLREEFRPTAVTHMSIA